MPDWVDDPDLSDEVAQRLALILVTHVPISDDIRHAVEQTGLRVGNHPFGAASKAVLIWPSVLKEAAERRKLRALIEHVQAEVAGAVAELDTILAEQRAAGSQQWYHSATREQARLLGPRLRWSMIDRDDLRSAVVRLTGVEGSPVLSIRGEPGCGKSHSRRLIQHVIDGASPNWQLVVLDVAKTWPADEIEVVSARDFVVGLSRKLGVDADYGGVPEYTESKRIARELVMELSGRFKGLPAQRRIIFVDGLDRTNVGQDVGVAVAHIADEIETSELSDTRLVVTGFEGNFATDVENVLERDRADPLTDSHVRLFFERIGEHVERDIPPDDLNDLVERTLEDASLDDLLAVGTKARDIANDYFGGD